MELLLSDIIEKVRIAIDEIASGRDDTFTSDADAEIIQAIEHAMTSILLSAPDNMLKAVNASAIIGAGQEEEGGDLPSAVVKNVDGSGYIILPDDFVRFVSLKLRSWSQTVRELTDPFSDVAKMQASPWGRGTPQKPRVILDIDTLGNRILRYWTAGRYCLPGTVLENVYDHVVEQLLYIPRQQYKTEPASVEIAVKEELLPSIVYRAAGIFLESKKEYELATQMYKLSEI